MEKSLRKKLYIKDGNGSTMDVSISAYQDEIMYHSGHAKNIPNLLKDFKSFPSRQDVWILAYPKCGTNWMCEIVSILLSGKLQHVKQYKESAMVEFCDSLSDMEKIPSPRVMNSHIHVKYLPDHMLEQSKIICVVRNPKSCAVSYFHHTINLPKFYNYTGTFDGFLTLYNEGIDDTNGNWYEFVLETWDLLHKRPNVHFVFYEDLLKDTLTEIKKISKFLEIERDEDFCEGVVKLTSKDLMSSFKEKDPNSPWHEILCNDTGRKVAFRKGIADDWKNHFNEEQNREFDQEYEEKMRNHEELKSKIKFE